MHKVCVYHVPMTNLHHRPWVVTGWLLCDLRWNGTQFIKRVGQESYFYPQNYYTLTFVRSRAAQEINGLPTPFLSQALHIHFPSLSHTHMHMHTLLKHHPFPLFRCKNGRVTFWWRNDGHGSLSSPWRMDLIHSVLVCAYWSTDSLS